MTLTLPRGLTAMACLTLTLTACGLSTDPFDYGDGKRIRIAVEQFFGELERADYTAAAAHRCAAGSAVPPTADELRAGFTDLARPWKTKLVSSQHTDDGTGFANLTLTDGTGAGHPYNVDFALSGGTATVCAVDTGTVQIDIDV
ncbi:hypothetical protein [Dactylosporangium sp. NPDC000521]|uniref:hypothetical protein n=1 Tax=Dactylosporangium sp. NPDC000521 TaxID=3363975 RepID=UPI0036A6A0BE